jgi:sacsin
VCTNNGDIGVSSPGQAYVPDDLQLKELFKGRSPMVNFTWHPNPTDPEIPLDLLFSIYNRLGIRNISQAVIKTEICMQQRMSLQKSGEGMFGMGLYRICVAYLAKPSFKLSSDKRHQLVRALIDCPVYGVVEPLSVEYSLLLAHNIKVYTTAMVRWEKNPKRLLIQTPDRNNQKAKMLFVTTFAEVISQGLLAEFPDLVGGLSEIIKLGCAFDFNVEAVDFMLQSKNLQLFIEDERFLSSYSSSYMLRQILPGV